jgi:N-acetylmuramoyl-L-alanine amidase
VAEVRRNLGLLGLLPPSEDVADVAGSVFDDDVDRAVRAFQQRRGLAVDGLVGPQTFRALDEARWRLGDRILRFVPSCWTGGDDVAALQRRLLDMGFPVGRVDGLHGPLTDRALREFQRNVGLMSDGTCGPQTLTALARLERTVVGGRADALREDLEVAHRGPSLAGKVIVLDPGHGGDDSGAAAHGLTEASIVEDLAARVEGRFVATGVQAYLTHAGGTGPDEVSRAAFANETDADLVVSLHVDAAPSPRPEGVATYFFGSPSGGLGSRMGQRLADLLQREVVARTGMLDGRIHAKTYDLLRRTRMPAVRLEVGYLTNPADAARLADPGFRDRVADAVVVAVQRLYLAERDDVHTGALQLDALVRR